MKNLSKQQLAILLVSFLSLLVLTFQVVTIDSYVTDQGLKTKYKSTLDSVLVADSLIKNYPNEITVSPNDIFNFKIIEKKKTVIQTQDTAPVIKTKWINRKELDLFGKDIITYSFYFNGKARFTINGKTQEVKVGDVIAIGSFVQKEVIVGTNEETGNIKKGKEYSGKVISIGERSVYVDTEDKDMVVQFKQNANSKYFARNLMQDTSNEEKDTPEVPVETPGRRNPRPGGR